MNQEPKNGLPPSHPQPPPEGITGPVWSSGQPYGPFASWTPPPPPRLFHSTREKGLAALLFVLTVASTYLTMGWGYSVAVMSILFCHEMGHYLMCRRYHVRSTLPLFIPMPQISPFGTMGAIIFMRQLRRDRKILFDIGIAGPLAGLVPTMIALLWGLAHSSVALIPPAHSMNIRLGDSLMLLALQKAFYPGLGPHQEVVLHPVAYAGWAGLFVTALNLLPIGQLDGGHVIHGLLGRRSTAVSWFFLACLTVLAIFNPQWWFLVAILLFLIGPRHRAAADGWEDSGPLNRGRVLLGILAMAVFVLCFIPRPFELP